MIDSTGKNVLVTGASGGIGRPTTPMFAEPGARVAHSG
jgi:NAD(P)-dependent dehydrogenase (short-subunit alcohol dehydrogenase family)